MLLYGVVVIWVVAVVVNGQTTDPLVIAANYPTQVPGTCAAGSCTGVYNMSGSTELELIQVGYSIMTCTCTHPPESIRLW
jgi:hypothetical protein